MQSIVHPHGGPVRQGSKANFISRFVASSLAFVAGIPLATAAQQQHVSPRAAPMPLVDAKLDPALLEDAEQLAANGFVREPARIRSNMRVVVELARDAEDVDFEATTRADLLAEVQYRTALRQEVFQGRVEGTLTPRERQGWNLLFPIDLQYMVAGEVDDLETLRAIAALDDVRYVWRDNPLELLDYEGTTLTGSASAAASGWTGAGIGVAVMDTQFDLLHPELGVDHPAQRRGQGWRQLLEHARGGHPQPSVGQLLPRHRRGFDRAEVRTRGAHLRPASVSECL